MKKLIFIIGMLSAFTAQTQTIYITNGETYVNIKPVLIGGTNPEVYLSRLHVKFLNDAITATISYDLQYSLDSLNYIASCMHSGTFTTPVDKSVQPDTSINRMLNYIKVGRGLIFDWE